MNTNSIPSMISPRADPPSDLTPDTFAARLYGMLAPLAYDEPAQRWALLILINAIGLMFQQVEDLVRDTEQGVGWSALVDLDRTPDIALPWLGQFVGVRMLPNSTPAEQRERILNTDGWKRGTPAALHGAALATLTGLRRLDIRERSGSGQAEGVSYAYAKAHYANYTALKAGFVDYLHLGGTPDAAYYLQVRTYASETPDLTATLNAILSQKPGGLVLDFATVTGQTYQQLKARFATYSAAKAAYPDYLALKQDAP
jgi:hypothetical protein